MTDIIPERIERVNDILEHHGIADARNVAKDIVAALIPTHSAIDSARAAEREACHDLLKASKLVLANLRRRIERAGEEGRPRPIFDGIDLLQNAINRLDTIRARGNTARAETGEGLSKAAADVIAERRRQVEVEGWTADHDDGHDAFQMASAAMTYVHAAAWPNDQDRGFMRYWPWDRKWWKPLKNARRKLVIAASLIIAEIDRIDRAASPSTDQQGDGR